MALPQNPPKFAKVTTGSKEYSLEINDANFETKAWKSSRYEGSKTITNELNKFSSNDITFGKTTAVQNYSRNIYIGNAVIGMDKNGGEDINLIAFDNFSYATTIRYITINSDGSISDNKIETTKTNTDSKRGFYRSFYEDFPIGSDCKLIINDESIRTNLKDNYNIYFNGGQLQKLISITLPSTNFTIFQNHRTSPNGDVDFPRTQRTWEMRQNSTTKFGALVKFFNENELRNFYTGSIEAIDGSSASATLKLREIHSFISPFFSDYRNPSDYIGDKRMFLTYTSQSGTPSTPSKGNEYVAIRTTDKTGTPNNNFPVNGVTTGVVGITTPTKNLAELSTTEIIGIQKIETVSAAATYGTQLAFSSSHHFPTNQRYHPGSAGTTLGGGFATDLVQATPDAFGGSGTSGRAILLTRCEDATPSLLLNLPKNSHLPDGIGQKSFVIIPENLHPHIKRNLTHFLAQAGISLGVDKIPDLDITFEKLK